MTPQKKIKILHVVNSLQIGGLEQVLVNILNSLDTARYTHIICCIDRSGPMVERIRVPVTIFNLEKGARADYLMPFKLARIIRREKPDIVHTRNWSAIDGVIAAVLAGVPIIVHDEHGRDATDPEGTNLKRNLFRKIAGFRIDCFIPVSADLEKWLIDTVGVASDKVHRILNCVDTERFRPAPDGRLYKDESNIDREPFVIGFVGRLDPVKDLATLIRAFALFLSASVYKARLCIVGNGRERRALQSLCAELGVADEVNFMGEQADIAAIMQQFDIFALTSIAEGIPMTVLEAMATGLPIVATDVGGLREVVQDGVYGTLTDVKAVDDLAAAFSDYACSREKMSEHGQMARKRVEKEFSLKAMVDQYDLLYGKLLAAKGL